MKYISPRNKGFITGALMVAVALFFFYGLKKPFESSQFLLYGVYTAGIIWCLVSFHNTNTAIKFKDYFSAGFKMFVIVTLVMVVFIFVFFYFNPEIRDARFAENSKLLLQEGNHTPAEVEKNTNEMKRIFMPMLLGITTFVYLFLGALITAIASGFLNAKRETRQ